MIDQRKVKSQRDKFINKARELGCDEDEEVFDERLRRLAKRKKPKTEQKTPKK